MSAQFGIWTFDSKPIEPHYLERVDQCLKRYAPDEKGRFAANNTVILSRAFHTTESSTPLEQPYILPSGDVLTWDGRLDNRSELLSLLPRVPTDESTDVSIVAAVFIKWGIRCFSRLIGDWALSIWSPRRHSLLLAKDFLGTRHLYYSMEPDHVRWSSILDALVLAEEKSFSLCEEYLAGWFSHFPGEHLTPYCGVESVPASSLVVVTPGHRSIRKFWDFDSSQMVRYKTDTEYEDHFRSLFSQAVRRRLRSDRAVLAELSGGIDSSAIVCVADKSSDSCPSSPPAIDTISYYNDAEPNWNERPYFEAVESKRGRAGIHLDLNSNDSFLLELKSSRFLSSPGPGGHYTEAAKKFAACITSHGYRVVLSGIGGDETTGGVPTPIPELANLLARAKLGELGRQLRLWALHRREPWVGLLWETLREFLPRLLANSPTRASSYTWLNPKFVYRNRKVFGGYRRRLSIFQSLPSFQENINTLDYLRRTLACELPPTEPVYEKRYPFLDRDLLQFLFSIPREQLVRPGQRRSLLRRALAGVVPELVLRRRRKSFVARMPLVGISSQWQEVYSVCQHLLCASLGMVSQEHFVHALEGARRHQEVPIGPIVRVLGLESWLQNLRDYGVWDGHTVLRRRPNAKPVRSIERVWSAG